MADMDTLMQMAQLRKALNAQTEKLDRHTNSAKAILANLNSRLCPDTPIEPARTLGGLLTQIDSITQGMERKGAA